MVLTYKGLYSTAKLVCMSIHVAAERPCLPTLVFNDIVCKTLLHIALRYRQGLNFTELNFCGLQILTIIACHTHRRSCTDYLSTHRSSPLVIRFTPAMYRSSAFTGSAMVGGATFSSSPLAHCASSLTVNL